jgi:Tat protein secretion system quality control protein TatD with DNase activity
VGEFLAELREEELAVLRETTAANTARLFALPSR